MRELFCRAIALLGEEGFARLQRARVAVFGLGGVGSYAAEALLRAGVGALDLVDGDCVCASNTNRQLYALQSTMGRNKAEAAAERARDICPETKVRAVPRFFTAETANAFDFSAYDYVADCIDSVQDKVLLLARARAAGARAVSCMGAGNKLDPAAFRVAPVERTRVCPLARVVRRRLREENVTGVWAVYSEEEPRPLPAGTDFVGSVSFVPPAAGLVLAGHIVRELAGL